MKERRGPISEDARWSYALESAGLGVWDADLATGRCYYSRVWKRMLGYAEDEIGDDGEAWLAFVHPDDKERALASGLAHIEGRTPAIETEFRLRHRDGHWIWVLDRGRVVARDGEGRPTRLMGVQTDITRQKQAEQELIRLNRSIRLAVEALDNERERLRITLQSIGEAVISTDVENHITFMNAAAEGLTQQSAAAVIGAPLQAVFRPVHEETGIELASLSRLAMSRGRTVEQEQPGVIVRCDGSRRCIHDLASPVLTSTGELVGAVLVVQDTTAARALQRDLAHAASHDMLTGLKSRAAFESAMTAAIEAAASGAAPHALLYVDLDRFKVINDTAGHAAGDSILKNVAVALRSCIGPGDIVARLGGDEFAVLLKGRGVAEAERVADRIVARISGERFPWAGKVHEIGASIGLAAIDRDSRSGEAVLAQADVACYAAKASGRNRVSIFRSDAGDAKRHLAELQVASGIRQAIAQNRFRLYAQEIRDLRSPLKRGRKLEILTRMMAPDGSIVPPGAFIPAAERFDLMGALDRWVVKATLGDFGRAIMAVPDLSVAVNLSANSLSDPTLWPFVEEELRLSGFDARRLGFEITETAVINNYGAAERFVAEARQAGCAISLDDFGSGVSSFAYLKRFTVDAIKIDGAFIEHMHESRYDHAIVRLIGEIAREIGVEVIAERVEQTETVAMLQSLQVGYGQGYLFHRPWPLRSVLDSYAAGEAAASPLRAAARRG